MSRRKYKRKNKKGKFHIKKVKKNQRLEQRGGFSGLPFGLLLPFLARAQRERTNTQLGKGITERFRNNWQI